MPYKVFLVEDEIVAREGIRDNVDWAGLGFEFCGEAPDGEIALPLIESARPDVLITDIKMPFMDGLQLSRLVRDRLPGVKIIILSGHDEFNYAQEAIKLGVTEYLLKPVGVKDLHAVLARLAHQLQQEQARARQLAHLHAQAQDNLAARREKLLLKLVTGGVQPVEALQQSRALELDIAAAWYQVLAAKIELHNRPEPFDYHRFEQAQRVVADLVAEIPDIFLLRKDLEELVLLVKGHTAEFVARKTTELADALQSRAAARTDCRLRVGVGRPRQRLGDVSHSFTEALLGLHDDLPPAPGPDSGKAELLKLDKTVLENFLRYGAAPDFNQFFDEYIGGLNPAALQSYLVKNYIFIDIVLSTAKFVHQLGGVVDEVIPAINQVEALLMNIQTVTQIKREAQKLFADALAFRDSRAVNPYHSLLQQAHDYLRQNFFNPGLTLNDVAAHVGLSPSHFSAVFSREAGQTFKECLTRLRIDQARELLRTTGLKTFEVAARAGYSDPHYFSVAFKKETGFSPSEFRRAGKSAKN